MTEALLAAAVRTPIGRYGGSLATVRPDDLAALVVREAVGASPASRSRRSTRSFSGAPTRRERTTATSPAWPPYWRAFPTPSPASP